MPLHHIVISLEPYQQTYAYDTGNNLTNLYHQANSSAWQQTLIIHSNNNRGTETQQSTSDFDVNGNLLALDNIGTLNWHYNNTLNKLTKVNKPNTTQYYVYDYQGKRVRTVIESEHQTQSQRDYLPALDISINQAKQQSTTLHIGTHILSESSKDNTQTHYQLNSHLQSNTLELGDKAQTLSYEHYYPYGGTAIIAGKDKTQAQQKRYRYTGKEKDDSSGLCYYGARYLAPWLTRWISPDAAGAGAGLNLYVYVGNNPLKYTDPTGHFPLISWSRFIDSINAYKANQRKLNIWVGEEHISPHGNYLAADLSTSIEFQNFIQENTNVNINMRPSTHPEIIRAQYTQKKISDKYTDLTPKEAQELGNAKMHVMELAATMNAERIGRDHWCDKKEYQRLQLEGSSLFLVGAGHTLTNVKRNENQNPKAYPAFKHMDADSSIAVTLKSVIDKYASIRIDNRRADMTSDFGVWVEGVDGLEESIFLVYGSKNIMKEIFGNVVKRIPAKLTNLSAPVPQKQHCTIL
ncbi:hypothetical protein BTURTLESOX_1436 [bacterium endosymbiont of Bathymodiolus sp. 5 South]|jgi:RHS repeat-associated protein|nr:hypothetical protein [uncultured Gammaproteobacteria bacterium]SSC08392.1 hypothetical protein BTURTLESOX_1436 [bacterium endosymbiont of Bathymodiolus sp. 5 South]VVM25827.1 hypothetical protein BSPWISOXPB_7863 [uncultured Gammaproteobacteria bacterium]